LGTFDIEPPVRKEKKPPKPKEKIAEKVIAQEVSKFVIFTNDIVER
jgi:hypothetical protein